MTDPKNSASEPSETKTSAPPADTEGTTPTSEPKQSGAAEQQEEGTHGRPTDDSDPGHS
ncbi:hypothetical protein GCM10010844_36060 [Deinococcus radiotolerans]|uniref:Uncharacterized protein n=1 Tax=Deinococcus radiotolerans TaxID=1309407 RepID=A0ABQ2FPH1_9DEIO|nr:hypothetical protein GCM10010844_36060 [Deinococcus radiotolerans]